MILPPGSATRWILLVLRCIGWPLPYQNPCVPVDMDSMGVRPTSFICIGLGYCTIPPAELEDASSRYAQDLEIFCCQMAIEQLSEYVVLLSSRLARVAEQNVGAGHGVQRCKHFSWGASRRSVDPSFGGRYTVVKKARVVLPSHTSNK